MSTEDVLDDGRAGPRRSSGKLYRELSGAGLWESTQAVDELIDMYRPAG